MENSAGNSTRYNPVHAPGKSFRNTLRRIFFIEKMHNLTGMILFALSAALIAFVVAKGGMVLGIVFILGIAIFPILYLIVMRPAFGMIVLIIMAFMLFVIAQLGVEGPIGTMMDALQLLLILGMLIRMKKENIKSPFKNPITQVIVMWLIYNILEGVNPDAASRLAWVYTVRTTAVVTLCYFVFMYNIRSVKYIKLVFTVWLVLNIIGAAYGYKQEYIGFNDHELAYLAQPGIDALLFIDGHWRKFSIFSDPVAFAYNMVMAIIFIICVVTMNIKLWKKIGLIAIAVFCFNSMLFSGTRGANVLIPAALILFGILKFNKQILVFTCFAACIMVVLIYMPTSNPNLVRFQTAFRPNNDASYNLRKMNQKRIQPYIVSHPFGGGLGATGVWGQRFAPNSYLAHFPPDSGYIRVAVEEGWVGLLVFCLFMFVIIRTGIVNFYKIKDPELKTYCLAATLIVFAYNLANFPQEALVQFPSNIMFYFWAALINITPKLDAELEKEKEKALLPAAVTV
jgi:putative inorganic carbon (HCO3(-)) transporter